MSKKLVVVCGATGAQGGSVVRSLLANGQYTVRGLTRDTTKPAAQSLAGEGVEMVQGSPAEKESLIKAFKGAYAVFGVTNPSFVPGPPNEYEQGKNLVDACLANNVPLFVWSSLPSITETSGGKYSVTAFDEKAEVDKYIKQAGQPSVIFKTGGFTSNLVNFYQLRKSPSEPSKWHIYGPWTRPSTKQGNTYVEKDVGPSVVAVIGAWEDERMRTELTEKAIPLVSYEISGEEKAAVISKITGKDVTFVREEPTEGRNAHPMLTAMYKWADGGYVTFPEGLPPPVLKKLGVQFHGFDEYVREVVVPYMKAQE